MAEGSWIRIGAVKANLDARTVNSIVKEALGRKAISITQQPDLRKQVGEQFVDAVSKFVPKKTGALVGSGRATDDGRVYWTAVNKYGDNYAGYVYDIEETRWPNGTYANPSTENTYPQWIEKVQPGTDEYESFLTNAREVIIDAFRRELDE